MGPDHGVELGLQPAVVLVVDVLAALDGAVVPGQEGGDAAHHVPGLALRVEDQAAAVGQVGPGPVEAEQVGEAGDGDPQVGGGTVPPPLRQHGPVAPHDLHGPQVAVGVEAGGVDDHVDLVVPARLGAHAGGRHGGDGVGDQLHVVAGQGAEPAAVVLEGALAQAHVVGYHLGQQVGIVADLVGHPLGEHLTGGVVQGADRLPLVGPVGVDPHGREPTVARRPEEQQPVPAAVEGQVAEGPGRPGGDAVVVVGVGEHPRCAALEDGHPRRLGGDGRHDLEGTGPGADDGHPLAGQLGALHPHRRVHPLATEGVDPREVGELGPVELADGADQCVGLQHLDRPVGAPHLQRPPVAGLLPGGPDHLGPEPDVVGHTELVHAPVEVAAELGGLGEEAGPLVVGREGVAVEVVADVDPAARVAVLPPRPARPVVLLHHGVRDAGPPEPDGGQQSRHAGPDDHHVEAGPPLRGDAVHPVQVPGIASVELELLEQERHVLFRHVGGHQVAHHPAEGAGGWRRREHGAPVAVGGDHLECLGADRRLVLGAHEPLDLVQVDARRCRELVEQRGITGHVHHRQEQRRHAHLLEGGGDGGVVVGDRRTGVPVAFGHGAPFVLPAGRTGRVDAPTYSGCGPPGPPVTVAPPTGRPRGVSP